MRQHKTYNHPKTGVVLVGSLVGLLELRHAVLGVDEATRREEPNC